ncbi:hypothetical protein CYMTET_29142 [Cymbomonas tetramitiformis]|uniref:Uncharacterized protein n=1 Tax=Cymbomonas tetramitiformis TaxID=36881 RepID=A0AAE0FLQ5_9CHLO|nr:hypothetical protein CYMTET_38546 [Cymbomonas tetramitiformis]KAK3261987.1 hypothetical protein CYMTET_29142 [Cymbomonas tetramitiformis]
MNLPLSEVAASDSTLEEHSPDDVRQDSSVTDIPWVPKFPERPAVERSAGDADAGALPCSDQDELHTAGNRAFVGDGTFRGDGGEALQRLWELWDWKPMRVPCPGRYRVLRGTGIHTRPEQVLSEIDAADTTVHLHHVQPVRVDAAASSDERDGVAVAHLPGGGGLITFIKADGNFVHTFNTEQNLWRKLRCMGLEEAQREMEARRF